jgi:hypothetical protein
VKEAVEHVRGWLLLLLLLPLLLPLPLLLIRFHSFSVGILLSL